MADDYTISIAIVGDNKLSGTLRMSSDDLKRFSNETRNATQNTAQMDSTLTRLRGAVTGFVGALALRQVIGFAEDMNELGTQVHANRVLFDQLTRSWGDSADSLQRLRMATGGVVDDMTLMSGANQLLRLNITETSRDTADLIGMIQRLKQPTQSTTDAIQNFALMLSNESLLRLDSFGISSANVKRRMDELGQSFREATMAEMANQIERLGDAADVAITPLARLQTQIENVMQAAGANLNTGVNAIVGGVYAIGDYAAREAEIGAIMTRIENVRRNAFYGTQAQSGELGGLTRLEYQPDTADIRRSAEAVYNQQRAVEQLAGAWRNTRNAVQEYVADAMRLDYWRGLFQETYNANPDQYLNSAGQRMILDELRGGGGGFIGGVQIFSPDAVARAQALADGAQRIVDHFNELKPFVDAGLISQGDLDRMQALADDASDFAKAAEKGAKALHDASLTTLLGQGGGVRSFSDLGQMSLRALADTGVSDDALARLTDAVQLATGEQTANSLALRDDILPLLNDIYAQQGQGAYVQALQGLNTAIQNSWANGTPLTPEAMSRAVGWMYQPGSTGGQTLHVAQGDTPWDIRQRTGLSYEDISRITGWTIGTTNLQVGDYSMGGGDLMRTGGIGNVLGGISTAIDTIRSTADVALDPMVTASESIVSAGQEFKGILDDISSSVHKVTIDLDVRTSPLVQWLFSQSGNGEALASIVRANGGVVPGSDPRSRQIER